MIYDIYEVRHTTDDGYDLVERVYQPSEPMYDSNALIDVIKGRVSTQSGHAEDELRVVNIGQCENIGGEPPAVG